MRRLLKVVVCGLAVAACGRAEYPFLQMEFCTNGEQARPEVQAILQALARQHHMEFEDRSAEAEGELRSQDVALNYHGQAYPLLMMRIYSKEGPSLSVNNVGLSENQLGMAVTAGAQHERAEALAADAIARFSANWKLRKVSSEEGIPPRANCGITVTGLR